VARPAAHPAAVALHDCAWLVSSQIGHDRRGCGCPGDFRVRLWHDGIDLVGPLLEAGFTAATILWIVFPALALHEVQTRSGASERIGTWLTSVSDRPAILVLILAWFFALLLEGAAGFGTPVALVAPMLVAIGFSPQRSLVLALIGHAAGVSFGAVGIPMVPLLDALAGRSQGTVADHHAAARGTGLDARSWWCFACHDRGSHRELGARTGGGLPVPAARAGLAWLTGPELATLGGAYDRRRGVHRSGEMEVAGRPA
jgi:lactate permease